MRKLIFNLHLYLALIAGVFVVILGVTGGIMAFEPELDHVLRGRYREPLRQIADGRGPGRFRTLSRNILVDAIRWL